MKKSQKIIVVISCLAVIASVLAVNCFAIPGSDNISEDYLGYTGLTGVDIEWSDSMLSVIATDYGAELYRYTNVGNHPYYYSSWTDERSFETAYGIQTINNDDADWTVGIKSTYKPIDENKYKFQLDWRRSIKGKNGIRKDGELVTATPIANSVIFNYGSFALIDYSVNAFSASRYKQDELTVVANSATYGLDEVVIEGHIVGDVVLVYTDYYASGSEEIYTYTQPITIYFVGYMPYGNNIKPFAHECDRVTYIVEYFDATDEEFHSYSQTVDDDVVGESIGTVIRNCYTDSPGGALKEGYIDVQNRVNTVRDASVKASIKWGVGGITSAAMNNYRVTYPVVEYGAYENGNVTVEEIVQVVEEVQVEPFEWIMQAADGVLELELFREITIGHLLMIAIAVPCLLAILRAIAGG